MSEFQVFVVGMNGSGTTMLADSLGKHEALFMFPFESKIIPLYLNETRLRDAAQRRALADEIGRSLPFWRANERQPLSVPDEALAQVSSVGALFDGMFMHLAHREGKRGWVEKSPGNIEHMATLAAAFPQARFLHIVRDGRDAAQSFHRRWWFDPRHTIWRWKQSVRAGRAAGMALGAERYMEVHYEDLTGHPEAWMRRICAFLGLAFSDAVLGSSMRHVDDAERRAKSGTIQSNSNRWQTYFDAATVSSLEQIAGQTLVELGYTVTRRGDKDLGRLERKVLRAKDAAWRTAAFFRDRGLPGIPMYVRLLRQAVKTRSVRRF